MTSVDFMILDWVQAHLRCGVLDTIMPWITALGEYGALWMLLTAVFLIRKDTRRVGVMMAIALALDVVLCNGIIKPLAARPRPFTVRPGVELLIKAPWDYSFPSGHTAVSFAAAGAMWFAGQRGRTAALILAAVIGLSRIYLYVHYPSDVICGAALGLLCGFLGVFFARKGAERCKTRKNGRSGGPD